MSRTLIYQVLIGDCWQYDRWAQEIAGGEWIGTEVFYQTPLYPYFLAGLYALFGHNVWLVRLVQAVLGSLACVLLARAGTHLFNPRVGWLSGLILAAYPPAMFFDGILQKASLDLVLMCGLLWNISRLHQRLRWSEVLVTGLLLGGLILNRENAWVLLPVLLAWIGWLGWVNLPTARLWLPPVLLIAGMALMLLPVGLRNYYVGREFLLTTSQMGPNFYIGNHRGAEGRYVSLRPDRGDPRFERTDARLLAEEAEGRSLSPSEISRYWTNRTMRDITADPVAWIRLLGWKWFLTWNQVELVDGEGIRVHADYSPVLKSLGWLINFGSLTALAAAGLWLGRRQWRQQWVLYGLMLSFALAVSLFFVFARYRYPLVPMVTLFAALAMERAWILLRSADSRRTSTRELGIAVGLAALVALATCWPLPRLYSDEVTYFSVGTVLYDMERYEEAMEQFETAIRLRPDFAPAYNNMANTAGKLRRWAEAESFLKRAIELAPNSGNYYANLALVQIEKGDVDSAQKSLRRALELDPYSVSALRSLSRLEMRQGNVSLAIQYLRQAIEVDRQSLAAHADLGMALMPHGQPVEAAEVLERALQLQPAQILVANNLAWLLATGPDTIRDGRRAVELATRVCERLEYKVPEFLDTLAAACAEAGDFEGAVEYAQKVRDLLVERGDEEKIRRRRTAGSISARRALSGFRTGRARCRVVGSV